MNKVIIRELLRDKRSEAMRLAVLNHTVHGWLDTSTMDTWIASTIRAMDILRKRWCKRLYELRDKKWSPVVDAEAMAFTMACAPFGARITSVRTSCHRPMICPFCYARQRVLTAFSHVESVFYADGNPRTKPVGKEGWYLIAYRIEEETIPLKADGVEAACKAQYAVVGTPEWRARERLLYKARYATVQLNISPTLRDTLLVSISGLLLTRTPATEIEPIPVIPFKHFEVHNLTEITEVKKTLARACANVFFYPSGMLDAPVDRAMSVMNALRGARLVAHYGYPPAWATEFKSVFEKEEM